MRSKIYCQCDLSRRIVEGRIEWMTSWIPEEKAKIGNIVRLRNSAQEVWSEGWLVVATYARRSYTELEITERDWTRQRKASDV